MNRSITKQLIIKSLGRSDETSVSITFRFAGNVSELIDRKIETMTDVLEEINLGTYMINNKMNGKLKKATFRRYIYLDNLFCSHSININITYSYYDKDKSKLEEYIISQIYKQNKLRNMFLFFYFPSYKYIEYINKNIIITFITNKAGRSNYVLREILNNMFSLSPINYIKDLLTNHREIFVNVNHTDCMYMNHKLYLRDKAEFINFFNNDLIIINHKSTIPEYDIYNKEDMKRDSFFNFIMKMVYISKYEKEYKKKFSSIINLIEQ